MSSEGTGSDISSQDAADLLHKLITESTKVQAILIGISSLSTGLIGRVLPGPNGTFLVKSDKESDGPFLRFDPRAATSFKFADNRAFPAKTTSRGACMTSALMFVYPDKTYVTLFEISPENV